MNKQPGNLIIVSGPSGAGKSALTAYALRVIPNLKFSISYTTRAPRGAERDGVEYFFVDRGRFQTLIESGDLLEWAEVHGNYYGTSLSFIAGLIRQGNDVVLDIDVQGAQIVRKAQPDVVTVFVLPPSFEVLRDRLRQRSLDNAGIIENRLKIARAEIRHYQEYDYLIINDDLKNAERELESIIISARCRMASRKRPAISILETFGDVDENP